jgi:hypothetical protein
MPRGFRNEIIALSLVACSLDGNDAPSPTQFGRLTAAVNGKSFSGSFGPDSIVAVYDVQSGQLQIEGIRQTRTRTEIVRMIMICEQPPKPGSYAVTSTFSPVTAGYFVTSRRPWSPRPLPSDVKFFISDSMPAGVLNLDALDIPAGTIKGRFGVGLRTANQRPPDTVFMTGSFYGRVRTVSHPQERWTSWSSGQNRNCAQATVRL